jgi:hypothetical protein
MFKSLSKMFKSLSKKNKTKKNNKTKKSSNSNSVKELCSKKYKDKSVRGTPVNWAYKRCIKDGWEKCKNLPPAGYGMYRYFSE